MTIHPASLISQLANHRVLVVGDVILDEYLTGQAVRMSREAPIPVLEFESRRYIPGGAANPSTNIVALGSHAIQIGVVGDDETSQLLFGELQARRIETGSLVTVPDRPTTLKTRILAQMGLRFPQQVARIDTLARDPIPAEIEGQIIAQIEEHSSHVDAILISDYHNGLLTPNLVEQIQKLAQANQIVTCVDAQGLLQKYRGFDVVKCNADDARSYLNRRLENDEDFAAAASKLFTELNLKQAMVITRGGNGATIANSTTETVAAPNVSDVYDTVGAGDTWIAVFTLARIAGASLPESTILANIASGIVVQHVGNYAPSPQELTQAFIKLND